MFFGVILMSTENFKRKLSAILSADVARYSRLMSEDDNAKFVHRPGIEK